MIAHIAHIKNDNGIITEQSVYDHSHAAATYARNILAGTGLSSCGYLAGLLHDMGKCRSDFQEYLLRSSAWDSYNKGLCRKPNFPCPARGRVIHTFHGCIYLLEKYHNHTNALMDITSEILASAIASHHGLMDCENLDGNNGFLHRTEYDKKILQYDEAVSAFYNETAQESEINRLFSEAMNEIGTVLRKIGSDAVSAGIKDRKYISFQAAMLTRLITSALMYGDRRDTYEFTAGESETDILTGQKIMMPDWKHDISVFEEKYSTFRNDSDINRVRSHISQSCMNFASEPSDIYRLNVPTGGGKTLSSLRYALYHAAEYNKKRIIYVIPTLSIIDQNAELIKEYLPDEYVLEHHSDMLTDTMTREELSAYELMKDRWDAPVIITTQVRLLDILFGSSASDITRMQALSDSITIFDEVQKIPGNMISLFTGALNFLKNTCNADILLSSATQPVFENTVWPATLSDKTPVSLKTQQLKVFDRHTYHLINNGKETGISELSAGICDMAGKYSSIMVVCNTRKEAATIYKQLSGRLSDKAIIRHLSAGMCREHRKKVLEESRKYLNKENQIPFILVTTQIIEAGVDISFRCVVRALAGIDSIIQAAGRCNRSNEYGAGDVYIVNIKNEENALKMLSEIAEAKQAMLDTINEIGPDIQFDDDNTISFYYRRLYSGLKNNGRSMHPFSYDSRNYCIGNILGNDLSPSASDNDYILNQPFRTAAENFKVFGNNTTSVLVPYDNGKHLINEIRQLDKEHKTVSKKLFYEAERYSVQLYANQTDKMLKNGIIERLCDGNIYAADVNAYDDVCGINPDRKYSVNDMIF